MRPSLAISVTMCGQCVGGQPQSVRLQSCLTDETDEMTVCCIMQCLQFELTLKVEYFSSPEKLTQTMDTARTFYSFKQMPWTER